ncbi:MAG: hypothetical protein P4L57_05045 [Rhizomicrobium sp.]|nr:hypothetical protein [Rhizomicrobium sp.]
MSTTITAGYKGLVLAIHPTSRGFGWVLFESPLSAVDWGIASAKQGRNARLLARFSRLLDRYEPAVLVLEEFESPTTRADRIRLLCRNMVHLASCKGADTPVYRRNVVRTVFATVGATTRYDIAQVIARHIDAFSHRMPKKRKAWESEDPRQSLFDAAALAITYFTISGH